ncbi:unnamed protein product [Aspergillus oryzae var. brunneus]|uniref:Unnamed protein product n=2 Tax=Aspergillus oryzae TaxID=5062 RepID=A0AAN5BXN4_ASPOZ|nr:unnamed protein product [Aspergillus oryzae]GMG47720.1 unnamed protein product [Aspergillus oryzae var. brunneus]
MSTKSAQGNGNGNGNGKKPASAAVNLIAGLSAGVTEAVAVVNPMEVVKIRLQAQYHSLADPLDAPKYRSAPHALFTVIKEEGFIALYRGVSLTALRQGTNQAANFTAYSELKAALQRWQPEYADTQLPSYQTTVIGLISGAVGPFSNAPIDTIKTRLQKTRAEPGQSAVSRIMAIANDMFKQEGARAFYKGITPRVMRVAPGQAVTFTVYEFLRGKLERSNWAFVGGKFEEIGKCRRRLPRRTLKLRPTLRPHLSKHTASDFPSADSRTTNNAAARLTPLSPIPFSSPGAFYPSLSQLSSVLQPKTPIYLLLRRPESGSSSLVALTYIPSNAPVRAKTLFASTRATLVRELGSEKFASTVFATEEDEVVGQEAWKERDAEKNDSSKSRSQREELMGEKERELEAVRRAEDEARSGTPGRDIGIGGSFARRNGGIGAPSSLQYKMPVDDEAKNALASLQPGDLVQLTFVLAGVENGTVPSSVESHISSSSPRYTFYHYPDTDVVIFVYTCPSGSSIKERMLYASSRMYALQLAEDQGLKISKKVRIHVVSRCLIEASLTMNVQIEASSPDEITGDRLQEEVSPPQNDGLNRGFARPRRPGR